MDLIAYVRILRRRWLLLLVPMVGAVVIALATLPEAAAPSTPLATRYNATATLIVSPTNSQAGTLNLSTVALFAGLGEVPERAAEDLGYDGEPQVLASQVSVTPQPDTGTLAIGATEDDPDRVVDLVNAFARATVSYFRDQQNEDARSRIRAAEARLDDLSKSLRRAQRDKAVDQDDAIVDARLIALREQYSTQYGEIIDLNRLLGGSGPLEILQEGVAIPQATATFAPPSSPVARMAISALLGLLLGAALALLIERVDSRLRTPEQVEESFALPVLAQIPSLPHRERRRRAIASVEKPASATAEAHRSLRSAVLLLRPTPPTDVPVDRVGGGLVVLVTSALPGEGKTTTVANLAAVMAEAGRRVLVLSFDLRNPRVHEYFQVPEGTGISDLLASPKAVRLGPAIRPSNVPGVGVVTSGHRLDQPGALLARAGELIAAARAHADVVVIDSAPMLSTSDAVDLAQHIDVALVVSRLNKTTTGHAAATRRLLSRLGVPALGTVLVGSRPTGVQDGVYRAVTRTGGEAQEVDRPEVPAAAQSTGQPNRQPNQQSNGQAPAQATRRPGGTGGKANRGTRPKTSKSTRRSEP